MKDFSIDYYILVTVASFGILQLAASLGGLRGLLVFRSALVTRLVGSALPVVAVIWFFGSEDRNVSDHLGGLSSNEVSLTFFLGALTAWAVTVALTSVVYDRAQRGGPSSEIGLGALRDATYFRALSHSVRHWLREWRAQMK